MYDVVIIGGGPAGSSCARVLAERGVDAVIVEKEEFCGHNNVCGGALNGRAIRRLGLEHATEHHVPRIKFHHGESAVSLDADMYTFGRDHFDRILADDASHSGAEIMTETKALTIDVNTDHVVTTVRDVPTGKTSEIKSHVVVGADGYGSRVRRQLNPNEGNAKAFAACVQYQVDAASIRDRDFDWDANHFLMDDLFAPGYAWFFPKKKHVTVGLGVHVCDISYSLRGALDKLVHSYHLFDSRQIPSEHLSYEAACVPTSISPNLTGNRLALIGDAAGLVKPSSCGGIEYAVDSGIALGTVLSDLHDQGKTPSRSELEAYQRSIDRIMKAIERDVGRLEKRKEYDISRIQRLLIQGGYSNLLAFAFTSDTRFLPRAAMEGPRFLLDFLRSR